MKNLLAIDKAMMKHAMRGFQSHVGRDKSLKDIANLYYTPVIKNKMHRHSKKLKLVDKVNYTAES